MQGFLTMTEPPKQCPMRQKWFLGDEQKILDVSMVCGSLNRYTVMSVVIKILWWSNYRKKLSIKDCWQEREKMMGKR